MYSCRLDNDKGLMWFTSLWQSNWQIAQTPCSIWKSSWKLCYLKLIWLSRKQVREILRKHPRLFIENTPCMQTKDIRDNSKFNLIIMYDIVHIQTWRRDLLLVLKRNSSKQPRLQKRSSKNSGVLALLPLKVKNIIETTHIIIAR